MALDVYRDELFVFIDLNPVDYIEKTPEEIYQIEILPKPVSVKLHRTAEYNVAICLQLFYETADFDKLTFNSEEFTIKPPPAISPVTLQLCLVFKNEWDRINIVLDYYKRTHEVERFILYDNQSDTPIPESIA